MSAAFLPRVIRHCDAPRYLGIDRDTFDEEVRPHLIEVPFGHRTILYDRLDLDGWLENKRAAEEAERQRLAEERRGLAYRCRLRYFAPWANPDAIRQIYLEARRISQDTGVPHQVDHIIPLQGRLVSGLHVETNLRIITAAENLRKLNKFEVV